MERGGLGPKGLKLASMDLCKYKGVKCVFGSSKTTMIQIGALIGLDR